MFEEVLKPDIPFVGHISGGLQIGQEIVIEGKVPRSFFGDFYINLVLGHNQNPEHVRQADVALHFSPRFDEEHIVLNSTRDGAWEQEVCTFDLLRNSTKKFWTLDQGMVDAD